MVLLTGKCMARVSDIAATTVAAFVEFYENAVTMFPPEFSKGPTPLMGLG